MKPIPEGSARTVSVTPAAETASISSPTAPIPAPTGVAGGMIPGAGMGQPNLRSGANAQPLFQGGVSTPAPAVSAAPVAKGGAVAKGASVAGANKGAINPSGQLTPEAAATTNVNGVNIPAQISGSPRNLIQSALGWLGGHMSAAPGGVTQVNPGRTTAQKVVGGIAGAASRSTNPIINAIGNSSLANQARSWSGQPVNTQQGNQIVSRQINPVQAAETALRSLFQNVTNKLRSLLK